MPRETETAVYADVAMPSMVVMPNPRSGPVPNAAIAAGYENASGTIFDANVTGLLAALALYAFGTGPLQGFAVTMGVGILTSMFTAITVSRALAVLIYGRRKNLKSIAI